MKKLLLVLLMLMSVNVASAQLWTQPDVDAGEQFIMSLTGPGFVSGNVYLERYPTWQEVVDLNTGATTHAYSISIQSYNRMDYLKWLWMFWYATGGAGLNGSECDTYSSCLAAATEACDLTCTDGGWLSTRCRARSLSSFTAGMECTATCEHFNPYDPSQPGWGNAGTVQVVCFKYPSPPSPPPPGEDPCMGPIYPSWCGNI